MGNNFDQLKSQINHLRNVEAENIRSEIESLLFNRIRKRWQSANNAMIYTKLTKDYALVIWKIYKGRRTLLKIRKINSDINGNVTVLLHTDHEENNVEDSDYSPDYSYEGYELFEKLNTAMWKIAVDAGSTPERRWFGGVKFIFSLDDEISIQPLPVQDNTK